MSNDRTRTFLRLINSDVYLFLRGASQSVIDQLADILCLEPSQRDILNSLHLLASSASRIDFASAFENVQRSLSVNNPLHFLEVSRENGFAGAISDSTARFYSLLRNKNVVLVGPSQSIIGASSGDEIEAFDIVVRLNFQWPVPPDHENDLGKRMDILYHCCNGDFPVSSLFTSNFAATRFVCWLRNRESIFLQERCQAENIPSLDVSHRADELRKQIGTPPSTGMLAIEHLLSSELKQLYVCGISFFQEPYYMGYPGRGHFEMKQATDKPLSHVGVHSIKSQLDYFIDHLSHEPRLRCDPILTKILRGVEPSMQS